MGNLIVKQIGILFFLILLYLIGRFSHILGYRFILFLILVNVIWIIISLLKKKYK